MVRGLCRTFGAVVVFALVWMLSSALAQTSFQQEITLPNGETAMIDWSAGQLQATGLAVAPTNATSDAQGRVLARRGAILDAQRMLIEVIAGVRIDAETTMLNAMANDVVRSQVEGTVQGAIVTGENWDGEIYTITLELPLERVKDIVAPESDPITPVMATGLVVDARDLLITPALLVDIYDANGDLVIAGLTALYNPSLPGSAGDEANSEVEDATNDDRVGEQPVVVVATSARSNRIDLVISTLDAATLLERAGGDPYSHPFTVENTVIIAN